MTHRADVELVLDARADLGEGPTWDTDAQLLVWVDITAGLVHRFDRLPKGIVRGQNENAFLGGIRLWERKRNSGELKWHLL